MSTLPPAAGPGTRQEPDCKAPFQHRDGDREERQEQQRDGHERERLSASESAEDDGRNGPPVHPVHSLPDPTGGDPLDLLLEGHELPSGSNSEQSFPACPAHQPDTANATLEPHDQF